MVKSKGTDVYVSIAGNWVRVRVFESEDSARMHADWLQNHMGLIRVREV